MSQLATVCLLAWLFAFCFGSSSTSWHLHCLWDQACLLQISFLGQFSWVPTSTQLFPYYPPCSFKFLFKVFFHICLLFLLLLIEFAFNYTTLKRSRRRALIMHRGDVFQMTQMRVEESGDFGSGEKTRKQWPAMNRALNRRHLRLQSSASAPPTAVVTSIFPVRRWCCHQCLQQWQLPLNQSQLCCVFQREPELRLLPPAINHLLAFSLWQQQQFGLSNKCTSIVN